MFTKWWCRLIFNCFNSKSKIKKKIDCFSLLPKDKNYDESYYINKTIKKEKIKHEYVSTFKDNKKIFST